MRNTFTFLALFVALTSVSFAVTKDEAISGSKAMVKELGSSLKGELKGAIKSGGFEKAIVVCKTVAHAMAEEVSAKHPGVIHRVSLKLRNEKNAPDEYERGILETMDADMKDGKLKGAYVKFVTTSDGKKVLRFMKPIVTDKICLNCHGTDEKLNEGAMKAIGENYPNDNAVGYGLKQVRGAFSVTYPME